MRDKKVSVIIVNWNGLRFLKDCLTSLFAQKYKNIEVILVDNASTDDSLKYVKENFPKINIIVNKENLGFSEANNIGYRAVTGDYVLFLNNDTKVTNDFITELIKVIESDPKIGGAQSKLLLMDDPTRLDSVGAFLTNTGFLYHYGIAKKDSPKYNKQIDIYTAKGASMIFKKNVLERIIVDDEILDGRYFAYFEETDMCHRVWLAGFGIVFAPKSVIYHKMGGTSTRMNNNFIQYHSFKNRINSYLKNLDLVNLIKILSVHLFICEAYAFYMLLRFNIGFFIMIQKAILWNVKEIFRTLSKRKYIQSKIRKINDDTLFFKIVKKVKLNYYYYLFIGLIDYED